MGIIDRRNAASPTPTWSRTPKKLATKTRAAIPPTARLMRGDGNIDRIASSMTVAIGVTIINVI
jgi:hypothetical protein